jgi:hypothetical protein
MKSPSLTLIFALTIVGTGCGSGAEDIDASTGFITPQMPINPGGSTDAGAVTAPGTTGGTTPSTTGGTTAGTGVRPGTTAGTTSGTTSGTGSVGSPGGTTAGTGSSGTDAGGSVTLTDGGVRDGGGTTTTEAGTAPTGDGGTTTGTGMCCPTGDCLCHGDPPARLSAAKGPYKTASLRLSTGTAYYPTDAPAPWAGIAICPGFTNTGPEMTDWGPFYASWGIVTVVTNTGGLDDPATRGRLLLGSVTAMKAENTKSGSPLNGKMSGRYGTSGYSMGGGGTTYASVSDPTLKSSVGLAAWEPVGRNVKVPTLLICGSGDLVAECFHSDQSYNTIPAGTPKMRLVVDGGGHLTSWFGPGDTPGGVSGGYALAFNKVYLEGDTRWKTLLLGKPTGATMTTTITP